LFIKPQYGGCSMGIHWENPVHDDNEFARVLAATQAATDQHVLIEEFINGREFTVGILGNQPPSALPLIEFTALAREEDPVPFRLFDAKTDTEIHEPIQCPAELGVAQSRRIQELAVHAFSAIGCSDYARVDIRCDKRGNPFVLEVNVHPSLLPSSSLPIMAEKAGIGYPQLFDHIFQSALSRYRVDA
jgi:D-alanine-D-alanine ligase